MSKTIDVEKGDAWTIYPKQQWVGHYRNGECIGCIGERYHLKSGLEQHLVDGEYNVLPEIAAVLLQAWGYTITTPAAKDEAPAKTEPDHFIDFTEMVASRPWGRIHLPSGKIRVYASRAHAERAQAGCKEAGWKTMDEPLFSDLAATVKRVEERVNKLATDVSDLWSAEDGFSDRLEKSDKYTADVRDLVIDSGVKFNKVVNGLIERLAKLEAATTPAKVRVVVPTFAPSRVFSVAERMMIHELNCKWIAALSAAGIDVVKEAGK